MAHKIKLIEPLLPPKVYYPKPKIIPSGVITLSDIMNFITQIEIIITDIGINFKNDKSVAEQVLIEMGFNEQRLHFTKIMLTYEVFNLQQIQFLQTFLDDIDSMCSLWLKYYFELSLIDPFLIYANDIEKALENALLLFREKQRKALLCKRCMQNNSNVLQLPCGHIILCRSCFNDKTCAACTIQINEHHLVFF